MQLNEDLVFLFATLDSYFSDLKEINKYLRTHKDDSHIWHKIHISSMSTLFYGMFEITNSIKKKLDINILDKQIIDNLLTILEPLKVCNDLLKHADIIKKDGYDIQNKLYKILGKPLSMCSEFDKPKIEQIVKTKFNKKQKNIINAWKLFDFIGRTKPYFIDVFNNSLLEIEKIINELNKNEYVISCKNYNSILKFIHCSESGFLFWKLIDNYCLNYKEIFSKLALNFTKDNKKIELLNIQQIDLGFLNEKTMYIFVRTPSEFDNTTFKDEFNHIFSDSNTYVFRFDIDEKIFNYNDLKINKKNWIERWKYMLSHSIQTNSTPTYYKVDFCLLFIMMKLSVVDFEECIDLNFYLPSKLFYPGMLICINEQTCEKINEYIKKVSSEV